jgi:protein-disulfide isomerase-like protein with CxxC motif
VPTDATPQRRTVFSTTCSSNQAKESPTMIPCEPVCARLPLDFDAFRALFDSPDALQAVQRAFVRCRQWGVRSFPTLLLEHNGKTAPLAEGYVSAEQVLSRLRQATAA